MRKRFKAFFNSSPNPYVLFDADLTIVEANPAYLETTGLRREKIIGMNVFEVFPGDPESEDDPNVLAVRTSLERVLANGERETLPIYPYTVPRETEEGTVYEERYWSASHTPILDDDGKVAYILHHTVDVTELRQIQGALRDGKVTTEELEVLGPQLEASVLQRAQAVHQTNQLLEEERQHLNRLFEQAPGFISLKRGPDHIYELVNKNYRQLLGRDNVIGRPVREVLPEAEEQGQIKLLEKVYETGEPYVGREIEVELQRGPGEEPETIYVDLVLQPIKNPDGSVYGVFTQGHEVTEQKRAKEELKRYQDRLEELVEERTHELEESQAALQHAQKMEAVGKLTGGVAHDFNNLLQVIGGNLQLLERDVADNVEAKRRVQTAMSAVERGAKMASQLLAFARQQPLEPKVLNAGRLVRDMDDLLSRALGETVEVETVIGGGLWNTIVDPHRLENVILNLAINARDAMGGEGKLTIEAGNAMLDDRYARMHSEVTPGQYVLIAVTDTGCGMPSEVAERAFEPFFTTKSADDGTGLGLSMAYGFVKQSGGHIKLYSEVDEGTTVKIYLPRTLREVEEPIEVENGPVEGGSETILVVEDDAEVRATAVEMLKDLGYRVLKASDGQSALAVLQSGMQVDLIFTDVVMPGPVRSVDLARQARSLQPGIRVLFTSGYTENAIVHGGRLDPGVNLLNKPYSRDELGRKVRHVLGKNVPEQSGAAPSSTDEEPKEMPEQPAPVAKAEALRILLVEDDEPIQFFVSEAVEELGHSVTAVSSAEKALEVFQENTFDVLFTDVSMPGVSGVELAKDLKNRDGKLQVVIASGHGAQVEADNSEALLGAIHLPKPYDLSQIEEVLEQLAARG